MEPRQTPLLVYGRHRRVKSRASLKNSSSSLTSICLARRSTC